MVTSNDINDMPHNILFVLPDFNLSENTKINAKPEKGATKKIKVLQERVEENIKTHLLHSNSQSFINDSHISNSICYCIKFNCIFSHCHLHFNHCTHYMVL